MSHNCNTYLKWLFCSSLIILHTFFLCYPLLLSYSYFAKLLFLSFSFLLLQFYTVYIHIHLHRVCIAAYEMGKLTYSNSAFKPSFMSIKTCSIYTYIHMYVRMNCKYISFFYITHNKATLTTMSVTKHLKLPDQCTGYVIQTWDDNGIVCLSCLSQSAWNKFFAFFFPISFYFAYIHIYVVFSLSPCFLVPKYDLAFGWLVCQNVR